jgi:DNA gyrase subunit A
MVNLLPLAEGESISTVLALPENEAEWGGLHIMFATAHGTVRRNSMAAFTNIPSNGKIAMRFGTVETGDDENEEQGDPTDRLIGVELLTEGDDVLLATRNGKAIRFKATDVREFQSRTSTGVRGVRLLGDDQVISMSILHRVGTTQEEREAYLRCPPWREREDVECTLPQDRYAELQESEQFILTVTENGYGKRSSAYEYRRTNRGGQGITNIDASERNGGVVASFPARQGEALMLVTDQGKMIRTTVGDIRIMGRNTQGVTIFRVGENEHVVSVAKIEESDEEDIDVEGGEELAPVDDAVIGESELEKPADPDAS